MSDVAQIYPPNPADVPPDLTTPSPSYRFRVVIVLSSLVVFLAVYLGLTVGTAYFSYYCFARLAAPDPPPVYSTAPQSTGYAQTRTRSSATTHPQRAEKKPGFWLFVGGVSSGLICLFMIKGLFKRSSIDTSTRVEVTEKDQPDLFAFIRRLCHDTGAPFPHRVYLVPDVNAAVAYHESVLNLFLPARKNLIIGLGLVNRLNLTEFKAVLAHEFGHFSQKSMKLGSYVYTTNRVVADVVYRRDWLDHVIAGLRGTDIRIAVFAYAFSAVLWTLRKSLELLFRGINFANSALSRQMEYNADLVAVSVSGSDALIFALARLDFAGDTLGQAWSDLYAAADHGRFSRDLYYHQTRAAEFLKARRNDPTLGEVPALPGDPTETVQVFKPEDTSVPKMWATHPANYDREVNAKARYVRGPVDDRPAWVLFREAEKVREAITRRVYENARNVKPEKLEDPETVQAFIDAEHAETTYHPRYNGFYDNRYVKPGDLAELTPHSAWAEYDAPAKLSAAYTELYEGVKARMDAHKARQEEALKLAKIVHGGFELRGKDFEHRGHRHLLGDAPLLLKQVEKEIDQDFEWMHQVDREVFRVHYAMASQLGEADRAALEERYRFHLDLQNLYATLVTHNQQIRGTLEGMSGQRQVPPEVFQHALAVLRGGHEALAAQLAAANKLILPPLTNMTAGEPLGQFLLGEPLMKNISAAAETLNGEWIHRFLNQLGEVIDKAQRVLFKSLGGLLAVQELIAERWQLADPAAAAASVESPPEATAG